MLEGQYGDILLLLLQKVKTVGEQLAAMQLDLAAEKAAKDVAHVVIVHLVLDWLMYCCPQLSVSSARV